MVDCFTIKTPESTGCYIVRGQQTLFEDPASFTTGRKSFKVMAINETTPGLAGFVKVISTKGEEMQLTREEFYRDVWPRWLEVQGYEDSLVKTHGYTLGTKIKGTERDTEDEE
jgi:hypothetical protein